MLYNGLLPWPVDTTRATRGTLKLKSILSLVSPSVHLPFRSSDLTGIAFFSLSLALAKTNGLLFQQQMSTNTIQFTVHWYNGMKELSTQFNTASSSHLPLTNPHIVDFSIALATVATVTAPCAVTGSAY